MKDKCALLITNDFPPYFSGGVSNYYYNLAKHASSLTIRVLAPWSPSAKKYDNSQGLTVLRVPVPIAPKVFGRSMQVLLMFLVALLESFRSNIGIVIIGHLYLSPIGYLLKLLRHVPYAIVMFGGEPPRYSKNATSKRMTRHFIDNSRMVIAISRYTENEVIEGWGYKGNIYILHPGVSTEKYFPQKEGKEKHYSKEDIFVLLSVSTLVKRKGHENTLKAIYEIKDEIPRIKYIIIGKGPEMDNLKELAYEILDMGESVEFLGFVEDERLIDFYNLTDVFVMPSRKTDDKFGTEGFGIVYLEANACGKPVIAGNSGGVSDAVVDGETGILVDPESVEEIAKAILYLYKKPEVARLMGKKGRRRVEDEFHWEKIAEEFNRILRANLQLRER